MALKRFVIVAGLSGAGKSQAMKSFEDLGFHCIDNIPPALVRDVVRLAQSAAVESMAVALDVRTAGPFGDADSALKDLKDAGISPEIVFLDATDDVLVRRYSETRRKHPFAHSGHLTEAIAAERVQLAPLRTLADRVWDTSHLTHGALKARVGETFSTGRGTLRIAVIAFGFKYGIPLDVDLLFDVRFLPNPNYVAELKPLTGYDPPVEAFMEAAPATEHFCRRLFDFMDFLVPQYAAEGKSQLTIAIGCTGGRHRSVYIARRLRDHLAAHADAAGSESIEARDVAR